MRPHPIARSIMVVATHTVAAAVLLSLGACEPSTVTDTSRRLYCQIVADSPERDSDDDPRTIVARVRYTCDPPGMDTLTLTLRLQRQGARDRWTDVRKTTFTVRRADTIHPDGERYVIREVTTPCADGVFRMLVTGSSKARGHTSQYEKTGPRSFDPCRPGLFATSLRRP